MKKGKAEAEVGGECGVWRASKSRSTLSNEKLPLLEFKQRAHSNPVGSIPSAPQKHRQLQIMAVDPFRPTK